MYCKKCGHRSAEKTETCGKCGAKLTSESEYTAAPPKKVRWQVFVAAAVAGVVLIAVFPRIFLRTELETIGPTDKLRFLRALDRSEYKRVGQVDFRLEEQTLIVMWDLRWNVLPEPKQRDIVRVVGHAWSVVGGRDTEFRVEGGEDSVALYSKGEVRLGPNPK